MVYVNPLHRARLDAAGRYESISEDRAFCVFRRAAPGRRPRSRAQERAVMSRPLISVIIPTYNRPA